jgi:PAS domain S-box-containing protein
MSRTTTRARLGFALAACALVADAVVSYANLRTLVASNAEVLHAREVLSELDRAQAAMEDAEGAQRGYFVSRAQGFLAGFRATVPKLDRSLDRLAGLTRDEPGPRAKVADLRRAVANRVEALGSAMEIRRERGMAAVLDAARTGRGYQTILQVRQRFAALRDDQDRLLGRRLAAAQLALRRTIVASAVGLGLSLLLLASVFALIRRELARRERAAEAVRRQEAWLSTTLASIGDAVVATDERGDIALINPAATALLGWGWPDAARRPVEEIVRLIDGVTRRPVEPPVAAALRGEDGVGLADDCLLVARDGTETPVAGGASPIRDGRGNVRGAVLVFRDIAERRRSEERYRAFIRQSTEGIWRFELDEPASVDLPEDEQIEAFYRHGSLAECNDAMARMYGYAHAAELVGTRLGDLLVRSDPGNLDYLRAFIRSGYRLADVETCELDREGRPRFFLNNLIGIAEGGKLVRAWGTQRDVTERRQIQEELRRAKEDAESANRAKDQFLAVLSHELRTPLNPVLLATSAMLDRTIPPEEVGPTLEMIRRNIELEARLIDDLLDMVRLTRGKLPLHREPTDAHAAIRLALETCRGDVESAGLRLELDLSATEHVVDADPARLQQVAWNLVKNAVKFTPRGGTIAVRSRTEPGRDGRGPRLVVEVADTGAGIEPDVLPRIFDPFQQGDPALARRSGGLGLGLTICRSVVESHGGTLTAESRGRGLGTTFRIELPALVGAALPAAAPPGERPAPPAPEPLKVLLVEDDEATLRLMARLLLGLGHEVTSTGTLASALETLNGENHFDLLISDIGLPDGSGLDLMRQVRSRRSLSAIALSGFGMEDDVRRSREAGFHAHLTKPVDFQRLKETLVEVTSGTSC